MTILTDWLVRACKQYGLQIDIQPVIAMGSDVKIQPIAHIHSIGGKNGMLIVGNYGEVKSILDALSQAGYGFSVLDEPRSKDVFDAESFKEMFTDWGWTEVSNPRLPEYE